MEVLKSLAYEKCGDIFGGSKRKPIFRRARGWPLACPAYARVMGGICGDYYPGWSRFALDPGLLSGTPSGFSVTARE